jgi:hypothetical protein
LFAEANVSRVMDRTSLKSDSVFTVFPDNLVTNPSQVRRRDVKDCFVPSQSFTGALGMRRNFLILLTVLYCSLLASSQTAEELVDKNIQAKGGMEKIKAIKTVRMTGKMDGPNIPPAEVSQENMRPNLVRETFSIQGMTAVQAYDGSTGWQIQPFGGKKDPMLMGDDDMRDILIDADFDGPMVDYREKGNRVEYLGHDVVDGDDALRLKVTLKNGDIVYYYLDPDTYLEIRKETQEFIRGSIRENLIDLGSYKQAGGVMFPFSVASGPKNDPSSWQYVTYEKVEVNVPLETPEFAVPASLKKEKQETAKN